MDGAVQLDRLGLPRDVCQDLAHLGSHGLSKGTWSSYHTAVKMLETCCSEKRIPMSWPIEEKVILLFVHWLLKARRVGASTIEVYLAGIRAAHIVRGWPAPHIKSDLINLIVRGKKNIQAAEQRAQGDQGRQPVTPDILSLLKARLGTWDAPETDKRVVWAVATVCFHGAFRMGELLSKSERQFDPQYTLLEADVSTDPGYTLGGCTGVVRFRIKSPKEDKKNRSLIVDVFGTGGNLCPVRAVQKWQAVKKVTCLDQPAFRLHSGAPLTPRKITAIMRERLRGYLGRAERYLSAHSFRIGLASMLASLGYSEEAIQAMGRWSSRAWLEYVRHPRTTRITVARTVGSNLG